MISFDIPVEVEGEDMDKIMAYLYVIKNGYEHKYVGFGWTKYIKPENENGKTVNKIDYVGLSWVARAVAHRVYKEFGENATKEQIEKAIKTVNKIASDYQELR